MEWTAFDQLAANRDSPIEPEEYEPHFKITTRFYDMHESYVIDVAIVNREGKVISRGPKPERSVAAHYEDGALRVVNCEPVAIPLRDRVTMKLSSSECDGSDFTACFLVKVSWIEYFYVNLKATK